MANGGLVQQGVGEVLRVTTIPRALVGLAVARIGVGLAQASLYLADYSSRRLLYGPDGVFPRGEIATDGTFNLYLIDGASVVAFEVVYHVGFLLSILMAAGVGGRVVILGVWATGWSLWGANPMIFDGGDNLAMIVLPMLMLSRCCDRLSLRVWTPWSIVERLNNSWLSVLLNNAAAFGIMVQLCIVYFFSGFYKAQGDMWVDGTALYYIMRTPEYFYPPMTPFILENDLFIVMGTYTAMILLLAFPFLVLSRRTRPWVVLAGMAFHVSIALFMGLTSFALVMIACDCVFISGRLERASRAVRATVRRRIAVRSSRRPRRVDETFASQQGSAEPLTSEVAR